MRLSLDALEVVESIARLGSFAAAAAELHRVPSALSYTIQKLEQDLDVRIFDRSGHRARLTRAGETLLQDGRLLLEAAGALESRVKQVDSGYEVQLRIAIDDLIPMERIYPLLAEFYAESGGTQLRLLVEVFGGTWDALIMERADLVIGAANEGPAGGGYVTRFLGYVDFQFIVAPNHPLATAAEPISSAQLVRYRAISAADSSRSLPPRTLGLLRGQDTLTVPDTRAKLSAHRAGLGVGFLPSFLAQTEAAAGRLIIKTVEEPKPRAQLFLAWRSGRQGKALQWFLKRFEDPALGESLLAPLEVTASVHA